MARSLQEMLAAIGAHTKAEDAAPPAEEPATTEGVADPENGKKAPFTKPEAADLPTYEKLAAVNAQINQVFGEEEPISRRLTGRRGRELSPYEHAVAVLKPGMQVSAPAIDNNLGDIEAGGSAGRTKLRVLQTSQDHANHIIQHLNDGKCADGSCKHSTAPVLTSAPAGDEKVGGAEEAWQAAHKMVTRWTDHFKDWGNKVASRAAELESRPDKAAGMLADAVKNNSITSLDAKQVSSAIDAARPVYSKSASWLKSQAGIGKLTEMLGITNHLPELKSQLDVLKNPNGKFKDMDPTVLHSRIQNVARTLYGLHKKSKLTAFDAVGMATPFSDAEVGNVSKLAGKLDTTRAAVSEAEMPRDLHPSLKDTDNFGNVTNPKVALAPHMHVWSSMEDSSATYDKKAKKWVSTGSGAVAIPVNDDTLDAYESTKGSANDLTKRPEYKRMVDLYNYYHNPSYTLKGKFYNPDGTVHIPKSRAVPGAAGGETEAAQKIASMTAEEKAAAGVEEGTHVHVSSPIFANEENHMPGSLGTIMKVTPKNLQTLTRTLGADHEDTKRMDDALRRLRGKPTRDEEANAAPPKYGPNNPPPKSGEALFDLPGQRQVGTTRKLPGTNAQMLSEAHDHIVSGTGTGVPGRGQIPAQLRRALGAAGIVKATEMANQTMSAKTAGE